MGHPIKSLIYSIGLDKSKLMFYSGNMYDQQDLQRGRIVTFLGRKKKEAELIKFTRVQFTVLKRKHLQIPIRLFTS